MIKIKGLVTSLLLGFCSIGMPNEGFWLPILLDELDQQALKKTGLAIPFDEVFDTQNTSLKDAVVQINQNCSGSIISSTGLVLTNYHCLKNRLDQIEDLSSSKWALHTEQEIPIRGFNATFIVDIIEVTQEVLSNIREGLPEKERQFKIRQNISLLQRQAKRSPSQGITIKSFFEDTRYFLFTTETFYDIRLAGFFYETPSLQNTKGSWSPNKNDFALIRIYANSKNQPAVYASNNIPFRPKKHFILANKIPEENDFSLTLGFPGHSQLFLPAKSLESRWQKIQTLRIELQKMRLEILDDSKQEQLKERVNKEIKRQEEQLIALKNTNGVAQKLLQERAFRKRMAKNQALKKQYASLLSDLEKSFQAWLPVATALTYSSEITQKNISLLQLANQLARLKKTHEKFGSRRLAFRQRQVINFLENFSTRFEVPVDQQLFASFMQLYYAKLPPEYFSEYVLEQYNNAQKDCRELAQITYQKSILSQPQQLIKLARQSLDDLFKALEKDYGMRFAKSLQEIHKQKIESIYEKYEQQLQVLHRQYLEAMIKAFPEKNHYPDANGTLRLGYGRIKQRLEGGWLTDIHTSGGSSGSPLLNAQGQLIGLITIRPPQSKASDWYYHEDSFRNYAIDIQYIIKKIEELTEVGFIKKALSE